MRIARVTGQLLIPDGKLIDKILHAAVCLALTGDQPYEAPVNNSISDEVQRDP